MFTFTQCCFYPSEWAAFVLEQTDGETGATVIRRQPSQHAWVHALIAEVLRFRAIRFAIPAGVFCPKAIVAVTVSNSNSSKKGQVTLRTRWLASRQSEVLSKHTRVANGTS